MLQQWARRYQRVAFPRYRPHKRARIHAFYKRGAEKWHIPKAVENIRLLLHISLFIFFAGLSVFLYDINRTIFKVVTAWIGVCVTVYLSLSIFPIPLKDSPCYTPISGTISFCISGIRFLFFRMFPGFLKFHTEGVSVYISTSRNKTAEEYALTQHPDIDRGLLSWTFESLSDEADFDKFFEGLPRLCDSDTGKKLKLKEIFIEPNMANLKHALVGLMDRTLTSTTLDEFVKHRRMVIFTKAMESESTSLLHRSDILRRVLFGKWDGLLRCVEFARYMQDWANHLDKVTVTSFYAQCVAALTISDLLMRKQSANEVRDWIQVVTNRSTPFHPPSSDERDDDILLTRAIFIVRLGVQAFAGSEESEWDDFHDVSGRTFRALCKLDIQKASPELQHEFCDLWNKLVITAQNDELPHRTIAMKMLKNIRKLYIALHSPESQTVSNTTADWEQILDNPGFYPHCTEQAHRSTSTFAGLQFNAPPSQPATPAQPAATTPNSPRFPEPHTPTHNILSSPFSSPGQTSPGFPDVHRFVPSTSPATQPVARTQSAATTPSRPLFPQPHTLPHNTLPGPVSSPGQTPSLGFPDAHRYVLPTPPGTNPSSP
jgi:hypothetical protein